MYMKLSYKLDLLELWNCNLGCRSACMYIFFLALLSNFLTVFTVRNWSSRHPHEGRQELPTGELHFSWQWTPVGEFLTVSCQESYSWRYFRLSWRFLAVRSFPFSGSDGPLRKSRRQECKGANRWSLDASSILFSLN